MKPINITIPFISNANVYQLNHTSMAPAVQNARNIRNIMRQSRSALNACLINNFLMLRKESVKNVHRPRLWAIKMDAWAVQKTLYLIKIYGSARNVVDKEWSF